MPPVATGTLAAMADATMEIRTVQPQELLPADVLKALMQRSSAKAWVQTDEGDNDVGRQHERAECGPESRPDNSG